MPQSQCYLFERAWEFVKKEELKSIPERVRGLYVLYHSDGKKTKNGKMTMNVVYVGMARGDKSGVQGRLKTHLKTQKKANLWTHFSVFEVWDNITKEQVQELEGLFRHIFRRDAQAQPLNTQRVYKPLLTLTRQTQSTTKSDK
jgi:hypothetical protein